MRHFIKPRCRTENGYAILLVLVFTGISLMVMGGALTWCSTNANLIQHHNQYYDTLAAAEAATEKVISIMSRDYQSQGEWAVTNGLAQYRNMVPTTNESGIWANYSFNDGQGNNDQTYISGENRWSYQALNSQFKGLYGSACTYRIISNARQINTPIADLGVGLQQDVQIASIPVFQFAIFYQVDLEINPGANMVVSGRVHSNSDIYTEPSGGTSLTFGNDVSSVGQIYAVKKTGDPSVRNSSYKVTYQGLKQSKVSSLTLPIGTNNSPDAVHAVIEAPAAGEDPNSPVGKQRYYNKADLVVLVSNNVVKVTSGAANSFATSIPTNQWTYFVNTNVSFYNKREGDTVKTTEIDVAKLKQWSATNTTLRASLGRDVRSIYVGDFRTQSSSTQPGVRLVNGQALPSQGLTVATPNPLYIKGNYNCTTAHLGTTNTSDALPASVVADAVTILSTAWSDANSGLSISSRVANNTTVNAAIIAGNVPTTSGVYSGGVENFPRFLENWGGKTMTYNGSMVVMFFSKIATAPWGGSDVYSPPNRNWAFDLNFMDATKLPPGTPEVRAIVRGNWAGIQPNTIPAL